MVTWLRINNLLVSWIINIICVVVFVFPQDDFYLNLVDWSGQNILSVGLGTCVYLWSACTSQVYKTFYLFTWSCWCFFYMTLCLDQMMYVYFAVLLKNLLERSMAATERLHCIIKLWYLQFVKLFSVIFPQVTKLCDLASDGDSVTSVSWSERVNCEFACLFGLYF